jgi:hypothetical protein
MIDADKIDLKKEIEELEKNPIKERGVDIKYLIGWVRRHKGDDGVRLVEEELKKAGFKMPDVNKYDDMEWIPVSLVNSYFVAMVKVFKLQEKDIIDMGRELLSSPSPMIKLFVKFFLSAEKTIRVAGQKWQKHYSAGEIEVTKFDIKNKEFIIRLKNIDRHRLTCFFDIGSFSRLAEIATGWENIVVNEAKCTFRGDEYHEFTFKGK